MQVPASGTASTAFSRASSSKGAEADSAAAKKTTDTQEKGLVGERPAHDADSDDKTSGQSEKLQRAGSTTTTSKSNLQAEKQSGVAVAVSISTASEEKQKIDNGATVNRSEDQLLPKTDKEPREPRTMIMQQQDTQQSGNAQEAGTNVSMKEGGVATSESEGDSASASAKEEGGDRRKSRRGGVQDEVGEGATNKDTSSVSHMQPAPVAEKPGTQGGEQLRGNDGNESSVESGVSGQTVGRGKTDAAHAVDAAPDLTSAPSAPAKLAPVGGIGALPPVGSKKPLPQITAAPAVIGTRDVEKTIDVRDGQDTGHVSPRDQIAQTNQNVTSSITVSAPGAAHRILPRDDGSVSALTATNGAKNETHAR